MRIAASIAVAVLLAMGAIAFQSVVVPRAVKACSCLADPPSLEERARQGATAVVAGTLGAPQRDRQPLAVETWYHGSFQTDVIWLAVSSGDGAACELDVLKWVAGTRWLLVLRGDPFAPGDDGLYSSSICDPNAQIGTPEGDALLADVVAAFGDGRPPPSPEPQAEIPSPPSPEPEPEVPQVSPDPSPTQQPAQVSIDAEPWMAGLLVVGVIVMLVLAYIAIVVLIDRRRRS